MLYARINLSATNYQLASNWKFITNPDIDQLNQIYFSYCEYKKFASVMPIFNKEYLSPDSDIFGYYHHAALVAFSLVMRWSHLEAECIQFAWNYQTPELELGIASLKNECAYYKSKNYNYLYLGGADNYKKQFDGFELLPPCNSLHNN